MKRLILWVCLLLPLSTVWGQTEDPELADCRKALSRAWAGADRDSIAAAYCCLTEYYAYRDVDSTRHYCEEGLKYADRKKAEPYLVLLVNLAVTFEDEGRMDEAMTVFRKAMGEAERLHWEIEEQASLLASVGVCYRRMSMPDSALAYYNRALDLLDVTKPDESGARTQLLTNIAVLYANTSRLDEAEVYVRRAMEVVPTCGDMDMVIHAASTAGVILGLCGKEEDGIQAIRQALDMAERQQKPAFVLRCLTYLAGTYGRLGNRAELMKCVARAEPLLAVLPENSTEVLGYYEKLFDVYSTMGRYRESLDIQHRLLGLKDVNMAVPLDKLYLSMARNYQKLKDYAQASDYYERAMSAADSLHGAQIEAELSELTVKYDTKEKELEIARLNEQHLQQQNRIMQLGIVSVVAVAVILVWGVWYVLRRRRLKKEEELKLAQHFIEGLERERKRLAKELHDGVCNDLLGIGMQMQNLPLTDEGKEEVKSMLEKVRNDVRCISHELMPPQFQRVTLKEVLEDYVTRLLDTQSAEWTFSSDAEGREWDNVPEDCAYEVYRILQELLSNILKHAGASRIDLHLYLSERMLTLRIAYRGKPCPSESKLGNGIGLSTTGERVKSIGATFVLKNEDDWQQITLDVPLAV